MLEDEHQLELRLTALDLLHAELHALEGARLVLQKLIEHLYIQTEQYQHFLPLVLVVENVELVDVVDALHEEVEQEEAQLRPVEEDAVRYLSLAEHLEHVDHAVEAPFVAFNYAPQLDDQAAALPSYALLKADYTGEDLEELLLEIAAVMALQ